MSRLRIVVGVDGCQESTAVIKRAVVLARALDADVRVVLAYENDSPTPLAYGLPPVPPGRTRLLAEERLAAVLASLDATDRIHVRSYAVVCGRPQQVLVEQSQGAELLVVGSSGSHSALHDVLLGSVADHCVRHAPCPVLVVRPHRHERHASEASQPLLSAAPAR